MTFRTRLALLITALVGAGSILFARGNIDLFVASWFFDGHDFDWRESPLANVLHNIVHPVAVICGTVLSVALLGALHKKRYQRVTLFLLLTLIIGPGIIVNSILKDHWDRARPLQVVEFGGTKLFTPPLVMANQCTRNCSFVAGDPAMGFWFHTLAYVMPRRRRQIFLGGMGLGLGYGVLRVGMGAHFLSDVFFAGVVITLTSALFYCLMFGRSALSQRWHEFLGGAKSQPVPLPAMERQLL